MPLKSGETVDNVYVKVGEFFREYVQIYSLLLTEPIALGLNTSHAEKKKKKRNVAASALFMSFRYRTLFYRNWKRFKDVRI